MTGGSVLDRQTQAGCGDVYGHSSCPGCDCPCHLPPDEAFAESVRSGKLWLPMGEFHGRAEQLLGRPILLHEFVHPDMQAALRAALAGEEFDVPPVLPLPDDLDLEELHIVVVDDPAGGKS